MLSHLEPMRTNQEMQVFLIVIFSRYPLVKKKSAKGRIPALDFSKSLIIEDEDIGRPTKIDNN